MPNNNQFSLANRKQFADLLADKPNSLRERARERFNEKRSILHDEYFQEQASKKGANVLWGALEAAKERVDEIEEQLHDLGFNVDYNDDLVLYNQSTNPIGKFIEERIKKEIGCSRDIDARFDSVAMAMMTVGTLEDAQKLLQSVTDL